AVAADTGGSIKGNKIDVHVPTKAEAYKWGNRTVNVTILK
ncbi:3D domain-containing protein, partial [Oceanobacillus caeni]